MPSEGSLEPRHDPADVDLVAKQAKIAGEEADGLHENQPLAHRLPLGLECSKPYCVVRRNFRQAGQVFDKRLVLGDRFTHDIQRILL